MTSGADLWDMRNVADANVTGAIRQGERLYEAEQFDEAKHAYEPVGEERAVEREPFL